MQNIPLYLVRISIIKFQRVRKALVSSWSDESAKDIEKPSVLIFMGALNASGSIIRCIRILGDAHIYCYVRTRVVTGLLLGFRYEVCCIMVEYLLILLICVTTT